MKSKWTKPKLTVLTRGNPNENILCTCKHHGFTGAGAHHNNCTIYINGACTDNKCTDKVHS